MRLIDADALENDTRKVLKKSYTFSNHTFLALHLMLDIIKDRETINVETVNYGKWIDKYDNGDWYCSVCGAIVEDDEKRRHNWYRCYHCGAKMEGTNIS